MKAHFCLFWILVTLHTQIYCEKASYSKFKSETKHVIIIGMDGFGWEYLKNSTDCLPNIKFLLENGAHSEVMRDVNPSISAPNWGVILTGMPPEHSGILSNSWKYSDSNPDTISTHGLPPISGRAKIPQTIFHVLKNRNPNLTSAVSINWSWIFYLIDKAVHFDFGISSDFAVAVGMMQFILHFKPNLMFVHFDSVDHGGHSSCWGCEEYYEHARNVDQFLGWILDALKDADIFEQTLVIVTADHGNNIQEFCEKMSIRWLAV